MNAWIALIPLCPFLAALAIGGLHFFRIIVGESGERVSSRLGVTALSLSCLLSIVLYLALFLGWTSAQTVQIADWLQSGKVNIAFSLQIRPFNLAVAALFSVLLWVVMRFAINYLHREAGFHRFAFLLNLFGSAMLLLVLSANALFTFVAWELAGVCSYLLIAYAYDRPVAAHNATRVFVTNRVGDGGFLLGIALALVWLGSADWAQINASSTELAGQDGNLLALCFALAACAKSAQVPFTPWLARAMEGPTPSSAVFYGGVMIHAGVFLLIQLQDLFEHAAVARAMLLAVGGATALYGYWVGLAQTDVKSAQAYAAAGQLGLMFAECGLGWWEMATWHMAAHAVVRCYLLLSAPSVLQVTGARPVKPVHPALSGWRLGFLAALQRGWLEPAVDAVLVKPVQGLGADMRYFDEQWVDPALGMPAPTIRAISSLAQWEERRMGANLESDEDSFAQGSGIAGKLAQWSAAVLNWFEYRFILSGIGRDSVRFGRRLGRAANRFERLLLKPRYLSLFVLIVLMAAAGYPG